MDDWADVDLEQDFALPGAGASSLGYAVTPLDDDEPVAPMPGALPERAPASSGAPPARWGGPPAAAGFFEPSDTTPEAAARSAGFTALALVAAAGFGMAFAGPWGGIAGVLATSTAFNGRRAQKWWGSADAGEKHEAVVSSVIGLATAAGAAYTGYRAYQSRKGDRRDE